MAYKLYKDLEHLIANLGVGLSVDIVLEIAKNIVIISAKDDKGNDQVRPLLKTDEKQLIARHYLYLYFGVL